MIVAVYFLVWLPALVGWGAWIVFLRRMLVMPESHDVFDAVFGIATLSTVAIILNFWLPITPSIVFVTMVIGWGLCLWRYRRDGIPAVSLSRMSVSVILILAIAFIASRMDYGYDAGFYHLPTIQWFADSALPLGLVNLHGRFGFNSSWLSLATLTRFEFADSYFLGDSALLLVVCALGVIQAFWDLRSANGWRASNIFLALTMMTVTAWPLRVNMSSPGSDLPMLVLTLLITYMMLRALEQPRQAMYYVCAITVLALFALTIKYSAAPLVLMPLSLFLAAYRLHLSLQLKRLTFFVIIVSAILVLPWIARGVMVSGCVVYPISSTCLPLQWTAPGGLAETEITIIRSWARVAGFPTDLTLIGWGWVIPWLQNFFTLPDIAILLPLFTSGIVALVATRKQPQSFPLIWIIAPLTAGILFWFLSAPDVRFGAGYFWAITLTMLSIALQRMREMTITNSISRALRNVWITGMIVWISAAAILIFFLTDSMSLFNVRSLPDALWSLPYLPTPELTKRASQNNVLLYVAPDCWLSPMPCTPYFNNNLRLQTLADGRLMFWFDSYILETPERFTRQP